MLLSLRVCLNMMQTPQSGLEGIIRFHYRTRGPSLLARMRVLLQDGAAEGGGDTSSQGFRAALRGSAPPPRPHDAILQARPNDEPPDPPLPSFAPEAGGSCEPDRWFEQHMRRGGRRSRGHPPRVLARAGLGVGEPGVLGLPFRI